MNRKFEGMKDLLGITASVLLLVSSLYLHCWKLAGTDFHSADLGFENPGQDNLFDHLNELKMIGSDDLSDSAFPQGHVFQQFNLIPFQESPLDDITLCLRC